ncbi:MAG: DUF1707 SHOCT-like domain-containing protein [Egibacteraceae bacterium]
MSSDDGQSVEQRLTPQDREAAERRLKDAFGDGLIELEEFDQRIGTVLRARTLDELEPALDGLPSPAGEVAPARRLPTRKVITAVLGEDRIEGRWRPADDTITVAALGETRLDFRDAQLDRDELGVTAVAFLGEVTIVVPPEVEVHMSGFSLLGDRSNKALPPADDEGPLLRVRAFALLGEVKVRTKERDRPASGLPATSPRSKLPHRQEWVPEQRRRRRGRLAGLLAAGAIVLGVLGAGRFISGYDATAVFSSTTYRVPAGVEQVDALSLFGSVDIVVPSDVDVEPQGFTLFGSRDCPACDRPAPEGGRTLAVRSLTLFGSLDIR